MNPPRGLAGRVVRPGDVGYDEARRNVNARFDVHPRAIVFCRTAAEVACAVRWARSLGAPLALRSGRHCYEPFSIGDGLVLDVSGLHAIEVDRARGLAVVGAGATLMPTYERLWEDRVTIPGGSCPTVGIAGFTLGGGYGLLSRRFGLGCDNLVKIRLVNAEGRQLTASEGRDPELFWACRGGGGGNFGVATSFTFRVHPIGSVVLWRLDWPWDALGEVVDAWQRWAPVTDDRMTSMLGLWARARDLVSATGLFVGPRDDAVALLRPLRAAGRPTSAVVTELPYLEAVRRLAGLVPAKRRWRAYFNANVVTRFKNTSGYVARPLGPEGIAVLREHLARAPNPATLVGLDAYGGAVGRVAPDATAFPHRGGVLYSLQIETYWSAAAEDAENLGWVEALRVALRPHLSGAAYVNYCDLALEDPLAAYYGANLARLRAVKARVDPDDFFHFAQSIPPAGSGS